MRSVSCIYVVVFTLASVSAGSARVRSDAITESWHEDYLRIQREMVGHQADATSRAGTVEVTPMVNEAARISDSDRDVLDVHLRRLQALLDRLKTMEGSPNLQDEQTTLNRLKLRSGQMEAVTTDAAARRKDLFMESRALARSVALQNPLLDFDDIIFNTFEHQIEKNNIMNHDQDVGYSAAPGGGIGIITHQSMRGQSIRL